MIGDFHGFDPQLEAWWLLAKLRPLLPSGGGKDASAHGGVMSLLGLSCTKDHGVETECEALQRPRTVLATVSHHSPSKVDTSNAARRGQKIGTSTGVGPAEYFLSSRRTMTGPQVGRPAALLEPRPQGRVQWHTVEHIIDVLPYVQDPRCAWAAGGGPAGGIHAEARHCHPRAGDRIPQRFVDQRRPQRAEQLVEVPTVVSFSSLQQQSAEQIIDIRVPPGSRGGGGGLQSFLPVQNSTAPSQQIVDIPVRSGGLQGFSPRRGFFIFIRNCSLALEGWFLRTFPRENEVRGPTGRCMGTPAQPS